MKNLSKDYPHTDWHQRRLRSLEAVEAKLNAKIQKLCKRIQNIQTARLLLGLAIFVFGLMFISVKSWTWSGWLFLLGLATFLLLVKRHSTLKNFKNNLQVRLEFARRQILKVKGLEIPNVLPDSELNKPTAEQVILDRDLSLLGARSLSSMLSEAFTQGGQSRIEKALLSGHPDLDTILKNQLKIKEYSCHPGIVTKLLVLGHRQGKELKTEELKDLCLISFVEDKFKLAFWLNLLIYPIFLALLAFSFAGSLSLHPGVLLTGYIIFSLWAVGKTKRSFKRSESFSVILATLLPLFKKIEAHPNIFQNSCPEILNCRPSRLFRRLLLYSQFLSIEAHWLVYIIVNIAFPWSMIWTQRAEAWRIKHGQKLLKCADEMYDLEKDLSFACVLLFQSPVFPEFLDQNCLQASSLYHPLISRDNVVANDVELSKENRILLITGSNMSGKSTFLRTLAINQKLALLGCPVFAENMTTSLRNVVTCLQITDSLQDGYSSFYYEVQRVAEMIEAAEKGESFLFFIDEIFRGTNNKERLQGSQAVIGKLASLPHVMGVITTHDLELTQLAQKFPSIKNAHFKDDVASNELTFNYRMFEGPCPTTNALKIMASLGLPVTPQ